MSVNRPSLTTVDGKLRTEPEEWPHLRKAKVFKADDHRINAIHRGTGRGLRNMRGRGITFDERMNEESPFPGEANVRYDLELNQNMDPDSTVPIDFSALDMERNEGSLYQLTLSESLVYPQGNEEERVIQGEDLGRTELDSDLLEVHAIVYEEDDQRHLMHWDPGVYDEDGEKHKYKEENNSPDLMEIADEGEDAFESYDVMELEKGLDHIYDELIEESEEIGQKAHQQMLENSEQGTDQLRYSDRVLESAWKAERWRGMADAVKTFKNSMREGYGQEERISF